MPAAMGSLAKATRYFVEGEERTRTRARVVEFDRNNPAHMAELVAQAMGFYPTRRAQAWNELIHIDEVERFWQSRRGNIYNRWDDAMDTNDSELKKQVLQAMNRYNKSVPFASMRLTRKDLMRSHKQRNLARDKKEARLPNSKKYNQLIREMRELFDVYEPAPRGN